MIDEAALLDRIRQYDQVALAQVYDDYYDRIYHYVFRFVGQVAAAEDLTANVFLRLLNAVRSGNQPRTNLLAWLYRVAHNLVVDSFRRGSVAEELELTEWLEGYEPDLTHVVEQRLQMERVRRAVQDLTPAQQQVIVLKFLEGLESPEVAAILNKSEGAVDALQHRALLALREALRPPPGAGPGSLLEEGQRTSQAMPDSTSSDGPTSRMVALVYRQLVSTPGGASANALFALSRCLQALCHSACECAASRGVHRVPWAAAPGNASQRFLTPQRVCALLAAVWYSPTLRGCVRTAVYGVLS